MIEAIREAIKLEEELLIESQDSNISTEERKHSLKKINLNSLKWCPEITTAIPMNETFNKETNQEILEHMTYENLQNTANVCEVV